MLSATPPGYEPVLAGSPDISQIMSSLRLGDTRAMAAPGAPFLSSVVSHFVAVASQPWQVPQSIAGLVCISHSIGTALLPSAPTAIPAADYAGGLQTGGMSSPGDFWSAEHERARGGALGGGLRDSASSGGLPIGASAGGGLHIGAGGLQGSGGSGGMHSGRGLQGSGGSGGMHIGLQGLGSERDLRRISSAGGVPIGGGSGPRGDIGSPSSLATGSPPGALRAGSLQATGSPPGGLRTSSLHATGSPPGLRTGSGLETETMAGCGPAKPRRHHVALIVLHMCTKLRA